MIPIQINHLKKAFAGTQAVNDISFAVHQGEIFGLIGPDGAGKTTTIRILVSLLTADAGQVLFKGRAVHKNMAFVRSQIGYMPQRFSLYQDLSVEENMHFFGDLFKVTRYEQKERMQRLFSFSNLEPFRKRRAAALSGGMKQKLALSCMLMHDPEVVVLDEPTYGVDPVSRNEFWNILKMLSEQGTSILVTTAYMDEAELCNRVGLIFKGRLLAHDEPQKLTNHFDHPLYLIDSDQSNKLYDALQQTPFAGDCHLFGEGIHLTDRQKRGMHAVRTILDEQKIDYRSIKPITPDMEDLFLELMQDAKN
ncbi:MAG: ATP-binding cassette domain-containing protein [Caldithrix sp.]|nr:ATP-binding cassette domain-containing protein [Caldithrix sp.]